MGQLSYASLAAPDLNPVIQGYPGDKPEKTQWRSTRTEITYNSGLGMYIGMDTFVYHGESGSALRRQSDNLILGVLTLGYHSAEDHVAYALTANYTMLRQLEKGCDYLGCSIPYYIEPRAKAASTTGPTPSPTVSPVLPKPSSTPIALPANAAPALLSPSTGSEFLGGFTGTLEWSLQKGATQVQLQVLPARNDGAGIDTILSGVTSFVVPAPPDWYGLLPGMSYSWRVRASAKPTSASPDDSSWGPWSETRTFWTPPPEVVLVPVQPAPNGRVRGSEVQLQWTLWNASIGKELFYWEVQLSSDSTFNTDPATATTSVYQNLVHGAVSETPNSWKAPILMPGTYFWRVRPRVQGDGVPADWSALWSFTVVP